MSTALRINKLEAACRQLTTALELYFTDGDPVSIHTLAAASYNLLRDINDHRAGAPMLAKPQLHGHKTRRLPVTRDLISQAENFFKHADRDPDATLRFDPAQTDFFLWDAAVKCREFKADAPVILLVFRYWFLMANPTLFRWPNELDTLRCKLESLFTNNDRKSFLHRVRNIAAKLALP